MLSAFYIHVVSDFLTHHLQTSHAVFLLQVLRLLRRPKVFGEEDRTVIISPTCSHNSLVFKDIILKILEIKLMTSLLRTSTGAQVQLCHQVG